MRSIVPCCRRLYTVGGGSVDRVRRIVLSPTWLVGHVLVLVAFGTCLWLGWWQLDRFDSPTGGAQNAGYALQWPVFGAFALFFWARVIRAELRPSGDAPQPLAPAAVPNAQIAVDERSDPELAAYNRYLAELHAADPGPRRGE
jgi:DNA-binding transcriptional regulator of glucitol operon